MNLYSLVKGELMYITIALFSVVLLYTYFSCKRLKEDIIAINKLLNDRINFNFASHDFSINKIQKELETLNPRNWFNKNTTKEKKK